jgi:hypothetical protein
MDKNGFHPKQLNIDPIFFKVTLTYNTLFLFNVIQPYTLTLKGHGVVILYAKRKASSHFFLCIFCFFIGLKKSCSLTS